MSGDIFFDGLFQVGHTFKHSAADPLVGNLGKETLNLIEPTAVRGGEMEFSTGTFGEPVLHDRSFVRDVIVQNDVQIQIGWDFPFNVA